VYGKLDHALNQFFCHAVLACRASAKSWEWWSRWDCDAWLPDGYHPLPGSRAPAPSWLGQRTRLLRTVAKLTSNVVFVNVCLVFSAALAAVATNRLPISREDLAALCARAERYIGTQVTEQLRYSTVPCLAPPDTYSDSTRVKKLRIIKRGGLFSP
jgi:hypothetical protein